MTSEIPHIQESSASGHSLLDPNKKYSQYERIRSLLSQRVMLLKFYVACIYPTWPLLHEENKGTVENMEQSGMERIKTERKGTGSKLCTVVRQMVLKIGNQRHRGAVTTMKTRQVQPGSSEPHQVYEIF